MNELKKISWFVVFIIPMLFCACEKHSLYKGGDDDGKGGYNNFDFSTVRDVNLQVSYQNMGGIQTSVYFEVYDEMPVTETEYSYVKKEGVKPLFGYTTEKDGTFSKTLTCPAYVETLYIYSPAFYARTLIEAKVENGVAIASDAVAGAKSIGTKAKKGYTSAVIAKEGWKTWLGEFDANGFVAYEYNGEELKYEDAAVKQIYETHANVLKVTGSCPDSLRRSGDLATGNTGGEIAVTFLGGNTCWNSSLGYYYYPEGQQPASLKDVNVIMLFPNTQDGKWANNLKAAEATKGINRGSTVQLKYYPHIVNGSRDEETNIFPPNYRIGFVLATNAWTNRIPGFTSYSSYRATTSEGLSVSAKGNGYFSKGDGRRSAVYRCKYKGKEMIVLSFEDYMTDENFSDVVFTVKSNPIEMIPDLPVIDPEKITVKTKVGVYAFEDMWPAKGDYDMNDVMVNVEYEKTFNVDEKLICSEAFIFKTFQNMALYMNGLGVTLENIEDAAISMTIDGIETSWAKREGNVILLTDNVKKHLGKEYKLTLTYATPIQKEQAKVKAFIWKTGKYGNWEVHVSKEVPTGLADMGATYFGQADDQSDPSKGLYYIRQGNYPFAIFLAGCTEGNIGKLLLPENETKPIDEIYSKYNGWVNSDGKENKDWYDLSE